MRYLRFTVLALIESDNVERHLKSSFILSKERFIKLVFDLKIPREECFLLCKDKVKVKVIRPPPTGCNGLTGSSAQLGFLQT